jgi:hypothetical protein
VLDRLARLRAEHRVARRAVVTALAALAAFSLWANFGLAMLYQRAYSPFPDNAERAAFVRFQHDLDERLPGGARFDFSEGATLPAEPRPAGSVFVVGRCEGVYWSDGNAWLPIEQTHASGRYPLRVAFGDRPPGTRETLLVAASGGDRDRLDVEYLRDHRVRLVFDSSRLDDEVRGPVHTITPGRSIPVVLIYDASLGRVGATFDGEPSLGLIWGPLPSPVVAGARDARALPGFIRRAELLPAAPRFCSDLMSGSA